MYCVNCGKEISDKSAFCIHCGAPVSSPDEEATVLETEPMEQDPFREEETPGRPPRAPGRPPRRKREKETGQRPAWFIPVLLGALAVVSVAGGMFAASVLFPDDGDSTGEPPAAEEPADPADGEEASDAEDDTSAETELTAKDRIYAARWTGGEEHTTASYDKAVSQGARCIEQDVRTSADGTLYAYFYQVFKPYGIDFDQCSDREIARSGAAPLELDEIFDRYGNSVTYVVELKDNRTSAADELADLVEKYGYEDNVIVQSFYRDVLREAHDELPNTPIMCLYDANHADQGSFSDATRLGYVDYVAVNYDEGMATEENCEKAHDRGKKFTVWNVDSKAAMKDVIKMGADSYFTTEPKLALEQEKKYRD